MFWTFVRIASVSFLRGIFVWSISVIIINAVNSTSNLDGLLKICIEDNQE